MSAVGSGPRVGLGSLGRRLLLAFVLVAVSSVLVLTAAALIGVDRGEQVAQAAEHQQVAQSAAAAAADAYQQAGGWETADLSRALAVGEAASGRLAVLDQDGATLQSATHGSGGNPGGPGQGNGSGSGSGMGQVVVTAPIVVDGTRVGTIRVAFGGSAGTRVLDVAWAWIAVAAGVALVMAIGTSWLVTRRLVRPIRGMTDAARSFTAGDRQARVTGTAPGELGELSVAFNGMADAVVRSDRDRRNLTADVAHELRTPLAALQAGLEELRDGLVQPTPEGLAGLHDQSLRLGRVVADLAELSAVETAGLSLHLAPVDLARLVREEASLREPQLRAVGLGVILDLAGPVSVRADADRVHQAVGNLLANAARYCRPGDEVTLAVTVEGAGGSSGSGGHAVLTVADSGPGIPADELPFIFDRLWRGRAAEEVAGSGIGLALVREIVTSHGGTIGATSAPGRGATITIRLPLSPGR
ncbi:HAMP domain-containing histidine kinase [Cryobacterium sp. TMT1-21]|uniref:histidine kinase n=1 Tax=Cryobacterium shii TaxID=1259235 RepID=A0AAQ2C8M1_9MICO|nr:MULTISPECIES: HAMP domain-containing sensor histidine kinase [Cryobacterium]TFC52188.1 HAMP domain-containing histidine kinase [Cryobacterium shii]TFC84741.1 HAMP domain-containing histidine kinase [Cryobacterium sp. TmT2-59]TFD14534.1 HAMP domain-containing histidine kinase [Cryobacterium sp. TMT4-10]TFD15685.1 HAMP domain-containing histidine kinase [Cryobacterium sp. TMT1-21]TFD18984.1 HAMP domain-containing histidine kinase [Cryobacterium sp. TMT2-23]